MSKIKTWLAGLLKLAHAASDEHLEWRLARHGRQSELTSLQALHDHDLAAQLQIKATQLTHELALLKTEQNAQLMMLETRCKQDIQDYKAYLEALAQLKQTIQNSYPQLPAAITYTIHHHAKQLLNKMWEETDFQKKIQLESELVQLMAAINEDSRHCFEKNTDKPLLPAKTLDFLQLH